MIGKWRRPPSATIDPNSPLGRALADLDREAAARPELAEPGRQLRDLLIQAFVPAETPDLAPVDRDLLIGGWIAGTPSFEVVPPVAGSQLTERLRALGTSAGLDPSGLVSPLEWFGTKDVSGPDAVYRLAWLPSLAPQASARSALLPDGIWDDPACPQCGRPGLLIESRGLEQRRFHRCGLCASSWPAARLGCPVCLDGKSERVEIRYLEEEKDRRRIEHCNSCGSSWKVFSTLGELSPPALMVAHFLSIHLDLLIQEVWPVDAYP